MDKIGAVLAEKWHFSETFRTIDIGGLMTVQRCSLVDQFLVVVAFAPRVVQVLLESGWTLDLGDAPHFIKVLRPAHLPSAVHFVDGAWVPVASALPVPGATP